MRQIFSEELSILMYPASLLHRFGVNGKISGSIAAVGEMRNVIAIIHGPKGCGFHYRYSARRRHQPFYNVITSDLTEAEIIYGGEEKLRKTILHTYELYRPDMIMVISSPVNDILGDDIRAVSEELRIQQGIPVISIASELFSHRDKNFSRKRLKELANQKITGDNRLEIELKGCGFTEALYALVDQVMLPAEIVPHSVNIETLAWGSDGNRVLREIECFLNRCGISVNCWIPSAPLDSLEQAPRAQLNLVKRVRWARYMKERFGTDYLHIGNGGRYSGLDGICAFYSDIGSALGLSDVVEQEIQLARENVLKQTEEVRAQLSALNCVLICRFPQTAPFELKLYSQDYGMKIGNLCIILTEEMRRDLGLTEELEQKLMARVHDAVKLYSKNTQIQINADDSLLRTLFSEADAVIGSSDFSLEGKGAPVIPSINEKISLSFESYVRSVNRMHERMLARKPRNNLLINQMEFSTRHYPLLCNDKSLAARELWSRLWLHREETILK